MGRLTQPRPIIRTVHLAQDAQGGDDDTNFQNRKGVVWFRTQAERHNVDNGMWAWTLVSEVRRVEWPPGNPELPARNPGPDKLGEARRSYPQGAKLYVDTYRFWVPKLLSVDKDGGVRTGHAPHPLRLFTPVIDKAPTCDIVTAITPRLLYQLRDSGDGPSYRTCRLVCRAWAGQFPLGDTECWRLKIENGVAIYRSENKWQQLPNRLWAWSWQAASDEWWVGQRWEPKLLTSPLPSLLSPLSQVPSQVRRNKSNKVRRKRRRRVATAGHRLPPELIKKICDFAVQELGTFRLVCQYWNSRCTPRFYERMDVQQTPGDVRDLWRLNFRTRPQGIGYMKVVENVPDYDEGSKFPWLHLLTQTCGSVGAAWEHYRDGTSCIRIDGPLFGGHRTIRSIHFALPRSPPPSLSRGIKKLILLRLDFRRFEDLTHLACELPDLEELESQRSNFGSFPTGLPHRRPQTNRNALTKVSIFQYLDTQRDSPAYSLAIFTLFLSVYSATSFFSEGEIAIVLALLQLKHHASHGTKVKYSYSPQDCARTLSVENVLTIESALTVSRCPHHDRPTFSVVIDCSYAQAQEEHIDKWTHFDTAFSKISASIRRSQFVFAFSNHEDMVRFAETIVANKLPTVSRRATVRYSIERDGKWYQASLESEVLQGNGEEDLAKVYT